MAWRRAWLPAPKLPGEARPGWKVLRALGGALHAGRFRIRRYRRVARRHRRALRAAPPTAQRALRRERAKPAAGGLEPHRATWPIYRADAVLRRATALNAHPLNRAAGGALNAEEALRLGLADGSQVRVAERRCRW